MQDDWKLAGMSLLYDWAWADSVCHRWSSSMSMYIWWWM